MTSTGSGFRSPSTNRSQASQINRESGPTSYRHGAGAAQSQTSAYAAFPNAAHREFPCLRLVYQARLLALQMGISAREILTAFEAAELAGASGNESSRQSAIQLIISETRRLQTRAEHFNQLFLQF